MAEEKHSKERKERAELWRQFNKSYKTGRPVKVKLQGKEYFVAIL